MFYLQVAVDYLLAQGPKTVKIQVEVDVRLFFFRLKRQAHYELLIEIDVERTGNGTVHKTAMGRS